MCGRIIDPNLRNTEADFTQLKIDPIQRRYNVKPTQDVVILGKDPLVAMQARWWLVPSWYRGVLEDWKATTFNARIEEAWDKPSFRQVWRHGRCLIPVGGFYEWSGPKGARRPTVVLPSGNEENFYLAGLASRWGDLLTCTVMTRAANAAMASIHHRMPLMLDARERELWLSGADDPDLGAAPRFRYHPVAPFALEADGPELLEPFD
ncbi:SOS response-associated peptidase [Thioclava kandeliae]|uniref:Abasic site processing protein n=1 Tax=Thioclava kandeliae TaxID=3070818 RepID=A0ABV1SMD4_9RHOB